MKIQKQSLSTCLLKIGNIEIGINALMVKFFRSFTDLRLTYILRHHLYLQYNFFCIFLSLNAFSRLIMNKLKIAVSLVLIFSFRESLQSKLILKANIKVNKNSGRDIYIVEFCPSCLWKLLVGTAAKLK